jgi:uncharacterized protein YycO
MKVIFGRSKSVGSLILQIYMKHNYSHVGVFIDADTILEAVSPEGVKLTNLKEFKERYKSTEERIIYTTRVNRAEALAQLGKPYDKVGLLSLLLGTRKWNDKDKWFCSELVALYSGLFNKEYSGHVDVKDIYKVSHKF